MTESYKIVALFLFMEVKMDKKEDKDLKNKKVRLEYKVDKDGIVYDVKHVFY